MVALLWSFKTRSQQLAPDEIPIPPAELQSSGLLKPSIIKVSKLITIHQGLILKRIGTLPKPTLQRVLTELQNAFRL